MSLIGSLNRGKVALISEETFKADINLEKKKFFENVIQYMDKYSLFNYLQITNPFFGFSLSNTETVILEAPVLTSLELLVYFSRYRNATFVDKEKLDEIRRDINENKF